MQLSDASKVKKGRLNSLLFVLLSLPAVVNATTFATMQSSIFNSNSVEACISCHDSSQTGVDRHSAPVTADFDIYPESASRADLIDFYISSNLMPNDPAAADFTFKGPLSAGEKAIVADWASDGAPIAAATATTNVASSISKTTAILNATVDTNVHAATTVPGSYFYQYGLTTGYGNTTGSVVRSSTSATSSAGIAIGSLTCETTYNFRVRVTNGHNTATGSNRSFKTSNCSAPVIRRNSSTAGTTESYTVGKGSSLNNASDFLIDATDTDGTSALVWTLVGGQPAFGTASVSGTGTTPTITYSAPANVPVPDTVTFDVRVSDDSNDGARTDTVTISIQIIDNPPIITNLSQPESITVVEDDVDGESVTLTAIDSDGDPLTWSVVGGTEPVNGTLNTLSGGASQIVTYTPNPNVDTDESFTVRVSDGSSFSDIIVNVGVTPQSDDPVANNDPNFTVLVNSTNNILDVLVNDTDVDSIDTKTLATQTITGSNGGVITVNNAGTVNNDISYTPVAGAVVAETFSYTVTDSSGRTDTALVTVSPPDTDGDGVFDYIDNCAATPNGVTQDNQGDNDGDQVINVNTTSNPSNPLVGGDACDSDDDNDGISDINELLYPGCLDQFNAADATQDCDGDGINNITEINDGNPDTNPIVDSVGPSVIAPADITVDATGLLTAVALGTATGNDGNDGGTALFKVAINLSLAELAILDDPNAGCAALSNYETEIEPFRPGSYTVTWATCDSSGNPGHDEQTVNVKPLVSVISGQSVGEGQPVNIAVVLNGDAIAYPAMVSYTITGTATAGDDHDGVDGTVIFTAPGDVAVISFNTLADGLTESDEIVDVTLYAPVNIALGDAKRHTVTITEVDIAPQVVLKVSQSETLGNKVYQPGIVTVVAVANDGNGDALSFSWLSTDAALLNAPGTTVTSNQLVFDPGVLTLDDFYNVKVTVSDANTAVSAERLLQIKAVPAALNPVDSDGDGIDDDDVNEGYGDIDADGIPNYLDHSSTPANAIETHTVNLKTSILIETDPGLAIALGQTAVAAEVSGVQVGLQDIKDHGGAQGGAVSNADTDYTFLSSLLSFEIFGLTDDVETVHVVVPLSSAIQVDAVYRKYNSTGWFDFVIDDRNELRSAAGGGGVCPQPGSNLYAAGLTPGHLCLQLTIQDGGANDADGVRNFVVKDPSGLALAPVPKEAATESNASGRVGSVGLWFMLVLLITVAAVWNLRVKQVLRLKSQYSNAQK